MAAHRLQYHRFKPYWIMLLLLPVRRSRLGVRWHREHRAVSGGEIMPDPVGGEPDADDDGDALDDECESSSLVTWRTF